jgi:SAM-dependent methyltransferase
VKIQPRECCICNSRAESTLFRKVEKYKLYKCGKCKLIYLDSGNFGMNPYSFYSDVKKDKAECAKSIIYYSFPEMYKKYPNVFNYYFNKRINHIFNYIKNPKSILDIGCGYGLWLNFCKDKLEYVYGIDLNSEAVDYARINYNLKVDKLTLEDLRNTGKKFDVITMCDVLEHIENPNLVLKNIFSLMHKKSILYIQVPDVIGLKIPYGYNLLLPHHLWQFNKHTLIELLRKNNFDYLSHWKGIMGIIGYYEDGRINLLLRIFFGIITRLRLGNRLMIAFRKNE